MLQDLVLPERKEEYCVGLAIQATLNQKDYRARNTLGGLGLVGGGGGSGAFFVMIVHEESLFLLHIGSTGGLGEAGTRGDEYTYIYIYLTTIATQCGSVYTCCCLTTFK